jgi:hypothetical protein
MKTTYLYLVILSPKRGWREALNNYVIVVNATSISDAIKKAPASWPIGDKSYLKPIALLVDGKTIAF